MTRWKEEKDDAQEQQSRFWEPVSWCYPIQLQNHSWGLKESSPPSGAKDTWSRCSWMGWVGTESEGLRTSNLDATTKLNSWVKSAVVLPADQLMLLIAGCWQRTKACSDILGHFIRRTPTSALVSQDRIYFPPEWSALKWEIWSERRDEGGAYSKDRLNMLPPGFWGRQQHWEFNIEVGQMFLSWTDAVLQMTKTNLRIHCI